MSRLLMACAVLTALMSPALARAETQPKIYALIVAHNGSVDGGVAPLRYADDDGARYEELFRSMSDHVELLTVLDAESQRIFPDAARRSLAPTRAQLKAAVGRIATRVAADRASGQDAELYLVFTGHGNVEAGSGEGYLSLADGKLRRSELYRDVISPLSGASFTHLIIDACHAYFMVQSRGEGWRDDRTGQTLDDAFLARGQREMAQRPSTLGVILSTSGAAEVHEWSKFRGGVFSHELRSGLLGAADVDGDGRVSYMELDAYLAAANASVTNPRARISVHARPPAQDHARPLVRLDRYRDATMLELPAGSGQHTYLEDARGLRYADLHTSAPTRMVLLREPAGGRDYYLRTSQSQARVSVAQASISASGLAYAQLDAQARSAVEDEFRTRLYATPFSAGFFAGYSAGRAGEQEQVVSAAPMERATQRGAWARLIDASYALSEPPLEGVSGAHHELSGSLLFQHDSGFGVGPFVSYGLTWDGPLTLHRPALGAELSWQAALPGGLWIAPRLRVGNQMVLLAGETQAADPLSLLASGALQLGMSFDGVTLHLAAGVSAHVITRTSVERTEEVTRWTPTLGIGARF